MSRNKGNRGNKRKWISIKKLRDRDRLKYIQSLFYRAEISGHYYDPKSVPSAEEVVEALRRISIHARVERRKYDSDMVVILFPGFLPICGTPKGFLWRLQESTEV